MVLFLRYGYDRNLCLFLCEWEVMLSSSNYRMHPASVNLLLWKYSLTGTGVLYKT